MILYLAGPMTGLPEFNYPRFHECAAKLRDRGYIVLNPAENKPPPCGTWQGWMRISLCQVAQADMIVMLEGWQDSRGAQIEKRLADDLAIPVRAYSGDLGAKVPGRLLPTSNHRYISPEPLEGWVAKG